MGATSSATRTPSGPTPARPSPTSAGVTVYLPLRGAVTSSAEGINNNGDVVGYYLDQHGNAHGFIHRANGYMISLDYPGATSTVLEGINDGGAIAGRYVSGGVTHGFVLKGRSTYLSYDFPGATATSLGGIDNCGLATGSYTDASGQEHALVVRVTIAPPAEGAPSEL